MTNTNTEKPQYKLRTPIYRRPIIIIPLVIIVILIGVLIFCLTRKSPEASSESDPGSPTAVEEKQSTNSDQPASDTKKDPEPEPKITQYEGEDPNDLEELTGSISYIDVEQGSLFVGATIAQYLELPGTCVLSLVDSSGAVVGSIDGPAHADITTSVCELPALAVDDIPSGEYQVIIKINADGKTGTLKEGVNL